MDLGCGMPGFGASDGVDLGDWLTRFEFVDKAWTRMLLIEVPQCETLRSAGWEVGEAQFREGASLVWMVYADRDGQRWIARGRSRAEFWQVLATQAQAAPVMPDRATTHPTQTDRNVTARDAADCGAADRAVADWADPDFADPKFFSRAGSIVSDAVGHQPK